MVVRQVLQLPSGPHLIDQITVQLFGEKSPIFGMSRVRSCAPLLETLQGKMSPQPMLITTAVRVGEMYLIYLGITIR